MTIEEMMISRSELNDALETVVWYNGHTDWLSSLAEKLYTMAENPADKYENLTFKEIGFNLNDWGTEDHTIWEILCSMYGEWGTSIRSGWLTVANAIPCANYIADLCADTFFYDEDYKGWSKKYPHIAKYYKETYNFFEKSEDNE